MCWRTFIPAELSDKKQNGNLTKLQFNCILKSNKSQENQAIRKKYHFIKIKKLNIGGD